MMRLLLIIVIGLMLFSGLTIFVFNRTQTADSYEIAQTDDPLSIVQKYCEYSEAGDYEKIKDLVTSYPDEYFVAFDKSVNLYKQSKGEPPVESRYEKKSEEKSQDSKIIIRDLKTPKEIPTAVLKDAPRRINRDRAYISEIVGVWTKGKEARVKVIMRSRLSERYRGEEEFLLYNDNGQWKIFQTGWETLFPVYGMPD